MRREKTQSGTLREVLCGLGRVMGGDSNHTFYDFNYKANNQQESRGRGLSWWLGRRQFTSMLATSFPRQIWFWVLQKGSESGSVVPNSLWPHGLYCPWNSPGQNTAVGSLSILRGIFPTQGSNQSLLRCRQILYHLGHQGSPRILEWVASPFSSGSSLPRNRTGLSCIAGGFFTTWATRDALEVCSWCAILRAWRSLRFFYWALQHVGSSLPRDQSRAQGFNHLPPG